MYLVPMLPTTDVRYTHLYATRRVELVPVIEAALERAGIPYQTGLQVGDDPQIVFTVMVERIDQARALVERAVALDVEDDGDERAWDALRAEEERERLAAAFPRRPLLATLALVVVHLWIALGLVGGAPSREHLEAIGALVSGQLSSEPWRLVTSLFLHSGPSHVLWNGLALVVFGVPAIVRWGWLRAALLYLASGVGGGIVALAAHPSGTLIVGSSGAVAGLFGAWLVATGLRARRATFSRRAWIRTIGLGLLVLPSLLTPVTAEGEPISIAAHLGGLATGALVALALARSREP
jgi:membrane associated rhomboid family serine protease